MKRNETAIVWCDPEYYFKNKYSSIVPREVFEAIYNIGHNNGYYAGKAQVYNIGDKNLDEGRSKGHQTTQAEIDKEKKHFKKNFGVNKQGKRLIGTNNHLVKLYRDRFKSSRKNCRGRSILMEWAKELAQKQK